MGKSRLKTILAEEDIQIKELHFATRIPRGTLSAIINGRKPQIENAYAIVEGLKKLGVKKKFHDVFPNYYSYATLQQFKYRA